MFSQHNKLDEQVTSLDMIGAGEPGVLELSDSDLEGVQGAGGGWYTYRHGRRHFRYNRWHRKYRRRYKKIIFVYVYDDDDDDCDDDD